MLYLYNQVLDTNENLIKTFIVNINRSEEPMRQFKHVVALYRASVQLYMNFSYRPLWVWPILEYVHIHQGREGRGRESVKE